MRRQTAFSTSPALAVKLSIVPQDHTDGVWPHVEGHLLKSYRRCDQNIPLSLRYDLRNGIRQLWLLTRGDMTIVAAGVTSMHALRSGLALKIEHFGGGSMGEWLHLLEEGDVGRQEGLDTASCRLRSLCIRYGEEARRRWVAKLQPQRRKTKVRPRHRT